MARYILFRFFQGVICIIGASVIIFIASRASGDVTLLLLPPDATDEQIEIMRSEIGLDKPLYTQYFMFAGKALKGDFGKSYRWEMPALELVTDRFPATIQLALCALAFSITTALFFGVLSAVYQGSWFDKFGKIFALLGQAMPGFWVGLMFILLFAVKLGWLPAFGRGGFRHLILPSVTLGWYSVAAQTRMVRSAMLDVLDSDYIKTARGVGVPRRILIWKYALRNAAVPLVTMLGVYFAAMLGGSFIIETIFAWPGVGRTVVEAIFARDYPVVQAGVLFTSIFFVFSNLLVDLTYGLIDPRIRYVR
ncbi:MAG: ABC transporter permease [Deltaproteobacteria bacterium]|nr:ABC transporter permease [Deltaproteobacteria bacterium]